jgi:hypothetical protein
VPAAEDERDNASNVAPHAEFVGNAVYEYLPACSRGTAVPTPTVRLELTTIEVLPGAEHAFETALSAAPIPPGETLWFRMVAGGTSPRYVRLRPRGTLVAILESSAEQPLPAKTHEFVATTTIEILTLRPTMSYRITAER